MRDDRGTLVPAWGPDCLINEAAVVASHREQNKERVSLLLDSQRMCATGGGPDSRDTATEWDTHPKKIAVRCDNAIENFHGYGVATDSF